MVDITAVGEILTNLTRSGVNEPGIPVFSANPAAARPGASSAFIGK